MELLSLSWSVAVSVESDDDNDDDVLDIDEDALAGENHFSIAGKGGVNAARGILNGRAGRKAVLRNEAGDGSVRTGRVGHLVELECTDVEEKQRMVRRSLEMVLVAVVVLVVVSVAWNNSIGFSLQRSWKLSPQSFLHFSDDPPPPIPYSFLVMIRRALIHWKLQPPSLRVCLVFRACVCVQAVANRMPDVDADLQGNLGLGVAARLPIRLTQSYSFLFPTGRDSGSKRGRKD